MNQFNHMYDIAFAVVNRNQDGTVTAAEVRRAILDRIESMDDDMLLESIGYCDTYEMEDA